MIERIASSLPIQGRSPDIASPVPEGRGFAEELAAATKTDEVKAKADDPQENKKNGCCGNNDNKDPASSIPSAPNQVAK